MKIIQYNHARDILVEFQDSFKTTVKTRYAHFLNGSVKNPNHNTTYNIGIFGNKHISRDGDKHSKEYYTWRNMLARCYDKNNICENPTYVDSVVCDEWLLYENFYDWLHKQENFNKWINGKAWCIDKDILIKGNKKYSEETCCLVPQKVNSLFTKRDNYRGSLPIGVSKTCKKYKGRLTINGKSVNFLTRDTVEEAFMDYKIAKESFIKQIAEEEYCKGNITKKCYDAMMKYEVEITD